MKNSGQITHNSIHPTSLWCLKLTQFVLSFCLQPIFQGSDRGRMFPPQGIKNEDISTGKKFRISNGNPIDTE